ncbi:hypothetical protein [Dichotomicrobium thermohalophilum]|uniref:Lectin-like protein BA14k n=1 Tax=Dichotomicrobium thermohalophilum TaxID=933063 RepID=A0A397Q5J9_9HYPH|nr:hypothetical protein [Dichotomicrobium thermohalophilum]RIA55719.1 hypothetical protein BXY53_0795 [Dichotomicrobium thermohalophilum]
MRGMAAICAVLLFAIFSADGALAATHQVPVEAPAISIGESSRNSDINHLRLADGGFISGLAVGVIGSLIVQGIDGDRHRYYRRRYRSCRYWHYRCGEDWGYHSRDYYGCMRYHRCR